MKKLIKSILAILLFSAFTLNLYADEKVNDEALKKEIPLKYVKYTGEDRSLSSEIEVWLDKQSMNLILTGYQLKDADIYVFTKMRLSIKNLLMFVYYFNHKNLIV